MEAPELGSPKEVPWKRRSSEVPWKLLGSAGVREFFRSSLEVPQFGSSVEVPWKHRSWEVPWKFLGSAGIRKFQGSSLEGLRSWSPKSIALEKGVKSPSSAGTKNPHAKKQDQGSPRIQFQTQLATETVLFVGQLEETVDEVVLAY